MLDTPLINVAIGLVFCFAATALAASTLTEALASLVKLRSTTLVAGVKELFNDPNFTGLAQAVYNHGLVHPQGNGQMASGNSWWKMRGGPSYIKAEHFAIATVDVLQQTPGDAAQLKASIDALPNDQLRKLLQGMYARADGDVEHLRGQIADWFNAAMDRVSGNYKRWAQVISFAIALLLVILMNVDATTVATTLWSTPTLARVAAGQATNADKAGLADNLKVLQTLPVGIDALARCSDKALYCVNKDHAIYSFTIAGWLITAIASVFGAPFWFDILQRLVQLRGAGPKPSVPDQKPTDVARG